MDIKLTFNELAIKVIKETRVPMSIDEIWTYAQQKNYDTYVGSKGKTPCNTLGARIYVDIRDNPDTPFVKFDSKPRKFFLKELQQQTTILEVEKNKAITKCTSYSERDLHPLLSYFVNTYLNVYTKTIYHERSLKKSYNKWLHPDIVGVNFPIGEWETDVFDLGFTLGGQLTKLFSFELKKELGFFNLRESYFQAVSNSSWANEGYLVTANLLNDEEFHSELKRLTSSFGIGIIKLDTENPDDSSIIFPAKQKTNIDWETLNKLSKENPDFKKFIIRVKNDINSKEIIKEKYDSIYSSEQLLEKLKKGGR